MTDFKLRPEDFDRGYIRDKFSSHMNNLSEHSRSRVDEAMRAAVAHVEKKEGLTQGMRRGDVDTALNFLDSHYEGRHDLKPQERDVIEKSFKDHFHILDTPLPKPHDEQQKAA